MEVHIKATLPHLHSVETKRHKQILHENIHGTEELGTGMSKSNLIVGITLGRKPTSILDSPPYLSNVLMYKDYKTSP